MQVHGRFDAVWWRTPVLTALLVVCAVAMRPMPLSAQDGMETVRKLVAAFNARDVDAVMSFFADDAVYHNMPSEPSRGLPAIRRAIDGYMKPATKVEWEILRIAQTGNTVLTERVDRFVLGGKEVVLPVMGAFEVANGKITAWRDYFDLATWQRQAPR